MFCFENVDDPNNLIIYTIMFKFNKKKKKGKNFQTTQPRISEYNDIKHFRSL